MFSLYVTYAISIALLISSPGPVISLVIADCKYGWPKGTLLGAALSALLLLMSALLLIHFALAVDESLLDWGRILGGAYLLFLGVQLLTSNRTSSIKPGHHKGCFWRAMKVGLSNPKDILFLLAFLPSFIHQQQSFLEQSLLLIVIWAVIDISIMSAYVVVAKRLLTRASWQLLLHYLPGVCMLLLGGLSGYMGIVSLLS